MSARPLASPLLAPVVEVLTFFAFAARAAIAVFRVASPKDAVTLLARLLITTLPVVAMVCLSAGAMLTVQAASSLSLIGGGPLAGTLVGLGGVREVFPLLAAASVAARSGAEFASALGAMRISEQVDALDVMGLDPARLLVAPRVIAATLGTPACVVFANAVGIFGSYLVGAFQLGIDPGSMWEHLRMSIYPADLTIGVGKGLLLGFLVGVISCFEGLKAQGGPRGVGRATNRAVVRSMVAVCLTSLVVTYLVYGKAMME